ncbi:MAG: sigma-70 family RNA polymerase sigma factor [Myxococcota bacterium]
MSENEDDKRPAPKAAVATKPAPKARPDPRKQGAPRPPPADVEDEKTILKKALPPPTKGMSRDQLANQYMAYVRSIAGNVWKTLSKDIEFDDLVSYGMLGLFEAADRFDAKFGANFMTFAYYRIRGAIYDGLRGMGWVSRTEYQRYRYEARANQFLANTHDREMAPVGDGSAKSEKKGKSDEEEVNELADVVTGLVTIYVTALDAMEGFQIKDDRGPPVDDVLELLQSRALVSSAVEKLPDQEKKLIQLYYYGELSLEEVGKQLGLSKSWTSRLHTRAIDKLGRLLKELVDEHYEVGGVQAKSVGGTAPGKPASPKGSTAPVPR